MVAYRWPKVCVVRCTSCASTCLGEVSTISLKVKFLLISLLPMLVLFLVGIYGGSVFRRSVRDFESVLENYGMIVKTLDQEEIVSQFERERVNFEQKINVFRKRITVISYLVPIVVLVSSSAVILLFVSHWLRYLQPVLEASKSLRKNDLTIEIKEVHRQDELGTLLNEFKASMEYLRNNLRQVHNEAVMVADSVTKLSSENESIARYMTIIVD